MRKINQIKNLSPGLVIGFFILLFGSITTIKSGETQWIAIGDLHNWYFSAGMEVEVGRRHLVRDQQDGLRWPAQFRYQDMQAAKALWIGATNYNDPISGKTYLHKVVHFGPRVYNELTEFMPQEFIMIGKFRHPQVYVDGISASNLDFLERVSEVDETMKADRLLYNVVNTQIGVTITRKIYAFSQQYHSNYLIYDFVFKNTGIIDNDGTTVNQTLDGVQFFFQYRYAVAMEGSGSGYNWLPQSAQWGHNTMNDVIYNHPVSGDPFRAEISWHGKHSKWLGLPDNIGGPNYTGDGRLGASQYVGTIVLHADTSPQNQADDLNQPSTTMEVGSDDPWTYNNDPYNAAGMTQEYVVMTAGRPAESHAVRVGNEYADLYGGTPGGYSQGQGFGPYTLAHGDSIHIVIAEAASGINRDLVYEVGGNWLTGSGPFTLPDGSATSNANDYKNAWVATGRDSIIQTFERARDNWASGFNIPQPPPPPDDFTITSGGDRIILNWSANAESSPNFAGYKIYRSLFVPDTTYDLIFACGQGTANSTIVHEFFDQTAQRGFEYYYYITAFDNGLTNDIHPGVPLESSKFYTMTIEPAYLRRPPGKTLSEIRVVPNPYNIRAREIQFGREDGADRIMFYNIPPFCSIKIYTERGDLIQTIEHTDGSGDEAWTSITSSRQVVVSGVYIAYFEVTRDATDSETGKISYRKGENIIKKFVIIR